MVHDKRLKRENVEDITGLTPMQQGMLFHYLKDPDSRVYLEQLCLKIQGKICVDMIKGAWQLVTQSNEMLRAVYRWDLIDSPIQVILKNYQLPIRNFDIRNVSEVEKHMFLNNIKCNDIQEGIDISKEPMRVTIIRINDDECEMIVTNHHIIYDGWSSGIIIKEFYNTYKAMLEGLKIEPIIKKAKFREYIKWNKMQDKEQQKRYWMNYLEGFYESTSINCSSIQDNKQKCIKVHNTIINREIAEKIYKLCKNEKVTIATVLNTAWGILLQKYNNVEDVVFGNTVSVRPPQISGIENTVGMFINTLPLRIKINYQEKVVDLLKRVENEIRITEEYKSISLADIQAASELENSNLFETLLVIENYPMEKVPANSSVKLSISDTYEATNYDITIGIINEDEVRIKAVYDGNKFDKDYIEKALEHFKNIIIKITEDVNITLSDIDMLSEEERNMIVYEFNNSYTEYPKDKTLVQLFEEQVEKTPNNIALIYDNKLLTYGELNKKANKLARILRNKGVKNDHIVAVTIERSIEMIIGILGILKAGGAYLTVDPEYPEERIEYMLQDSSVKILLTQKYLTNKVQYAGDIIDIECEEIYLQDNSNLRLEINQNDLAYIIYTSGTSGKPKGVMIPHNAICNRLFWAQDTYNLCENDCVLQGAALSFDFSVWEIFGALTSGAKLLLPYHKGMQDFKYIISIMIKHDVTIAHFVPSVLKLLLEIQEITLCHNLRILFSGGEPLTKDIRDHVFQYLNVKLYNQYGPTETTIDSTYYYCERDSREKSIPIGKPISNTVIYILDKSLHPTPIGVPGELYIGGSGLARGYINNPDLTNQKFITNPFNSQTNERLYKTGDLAKYLPDGNIEFIGRIDQQVKIHGIRIELNEIEQVIRNYTDICDAIVKENEKNDGDKQLVAYFISKKEKATIFKGHKRFKLPNNLAVAQLNKNETEFLYKEIFETQAYLKHGITIKNGDCIFDVGSNIGLFTLFSHLVANDTQIYSFEPNPYVFEILKINKDLYNVNTKLYNCGLSNTDKTANFTFYPEFSFLSGMYTDVDDEKKVVKSFIAKENQSTDTQVKNILSNELLDEFLEEKLKKETFNVQLVTISEIIRENNIKCIDLLKINVEKSELDVLYGLNDCDWYKIKQIVLEVHDIDGRLNIINKLFEEKGYSIEIEKDWSLEESSNTNYYVYAIRHENLCTLTEKQKNKFEKPNIQLSEPYISQMELRNFVKKSLPEYMIPSYFIELEAIPLTPNGKIDRRALPEPEGNIGRGTSYSAARNWTEQKLVEIWQKVLGIENIGIFDNFFELGGHSLKAIQIVNQIHKVLNIQIGFKEFFDYQTIASLGEYIKNHEGTGYEQIEELPKQEHYALSYAQQRLWIISQKEPENTAYNMAGRMLFKENMNIQAVEKAFEQLLERHEGLRTRFATIEGIPVQIIEEHIDFKVTFRDLSLIEKPEMENGREAIYTAISEHIFRLDKAPLLIAELVKLKETEYELFICMHHIVSDGWSMNLLREEFIHLYEANSKDINIEMVPLKIQYKDFAAWQNRQIESSRKMEIAKSYWYEQLRNNPSPLSISHREQGEALRGKTGETRCIIIEKDIKEKLKILAKEQQTSLFMVLLSALNILLMDLTGENDILIGTPGSGRDHESLEKIIGYFINTIILRNQVYEDESFESALGRINKNTLTALEYQSFPLEKLVEEFDIKFPQIKIFFNMLNIGGSENQKFDSNAANAVEALKDIKFELVFYVKEYSDALEITCLYAKEFFKSSRIASIIGKYTGLLERIAENSNETVLDYLD